MSKATHTFITLALLVLAGAASAAPVSVRLDAHNQRSASGVLSTLKWAACTPVLATNPCLSTSASAGGVWSNANATPSTAVWTWDAATGVLSMTGIFQSTSFISSNANGTPVISDRVVDMVINTTANTTTAASYRCVEGTFLSSVGANGCLNVSLGDDFALGSSALYDVNGNALCVQRTVGGDDVSTGNTRGVASVAAAPPCEAADGAFDLWNVESDATAGGGQLIVRNSVTIDLAGTNFLTFTALPTANDDGPVTAIQGTPTTIDVLANDRGFTNPITVTVSTLPTKGTATVQGTSPGIQIVYTANFDATGADSFVYTVQGTNGTDTATVTIDIPPPGANPDTVSTTRNKPITISIGANDPGFTDPVTITIPVAPDQGGTATPPASGPLLTALISYAPEIRAPGIPGYTETFTYQVTDANLLTDSAVVTVTVSNTVPAAGSTGISLSTKGAAPAGLTGSFDAANFAGNSLGDAPSVVTFTDPGKGTVAPSPGNANVLVYTPDADFFSGTDTFNYTITDSDPAPVESATGTVTITIPPETPTVAGGSKSGNQDTTLSASGAFTAGNGSVAQHTLTVNTQATSGTCGNPSVSGTNITVSYTPNAGFSGNDSCVVRLADAEGDFADGTYSFTVNAKGGSGGTGGLLPGGSGAFDLWSLALLSGLPLLGRLRASRRRQAAGNR